MKSSKRILLSLIIISFFMILAAGSSIGDEEAEPEKVFEPAAATEEPGALTEEPAITSEEIGALDDAIDDLDIEEIEQKFAIILQDSFGDAAKVEFVEAEKTYYITPSDPSVLEEIINALEGDAYAVASWESFTESLVELSRVMIDLLPGYWLEIKNPETPELSLLIIKDGEVIYDVLKDEDM